MKGTDGIIIVGASGHGKVILSCLLANGEKVLGFVDDNPALYGSFLMGYPIIGNSNLLVDAVHQRIVIAIGDNLIRRKVAKKLSHCIAQSVIHPHAFVDPSVKIGAGSVVFAGALIQPDSRIGEHVIINTAASLDANCLIDNFVHIAPGVKVASHVSIEEGSFVGLQSVVRANLQIGEWSIIGAGSVVVEAISAKQYAKGQPAVMYKVHRCSP